MWYRVHLAWTGLDWIREHGKIYKGVAYCLIAGVFILIGVVVYGTQEGIDKNSLHFAFVFCILAAIGSAIAAVLLIIGHRLGNLAALIYHMCKL